MNLFDNLPWLAGQQRRRLCVHIVFLFLLLQVFINVLHSSHCQVCCEATISKDVALADTNGSGELHTKACISTVCSVAAAAPAGTSGNNVKRLNRRGVIPPHPLDMMLVITVDGTASAVRKSTGEVLWRQSDLGGPLVTTYAVHGPNGLPSSSGNNDHYNEDDDKDKRSHGKTANSKPRKNANIAVAAAAADSKTKNSAQQGARDSRPNVAETIVDDGDEQQPSGHERIMYLPEPSGDGALYVYAVDKGLQRLPFSLRDLTSGPPFSALDGTVYVAKQQSTMYAVDPRKGQLLHKYDTDSQDVWVESPSLPPDTLFIGRREYTLTIYGAHGKKSHWNITYGEFSFTNMDRTAPTPNSRTLGDIHVVPDQKGRMMASQGSHSGTAWQTGFAAPIVTVFDVLRNSDIEGRMVLYKQDLDQGMPKTLSSVRRLWDKIRGDVPSALIDIHQGHMFVMSSEHFPLPIVNNDKKLVRAKCAEGADPLSSKCMLGRHHVIAPSAEPIVPDAVGGGQLNPAMPQSNGNSPLTIDAGQHDSAYVGNELDAGMMQKLFQLPSMTYSWWWYNAASWIRWLTGLCVLTGVVSLSLMRYYGLIGWLSASRLEDGTSASDEASAGANNADAAAPNGTPKTKPSRRRRKKQMTEVGPDQTNGQEQSTTVTTKERSIRELMQPAPSDNPIIDTSDVIFQQPTMFTIDRVDSVIGAAALKRHDTNGSVMLNSLTVSNEVLGYGSHGTVVFRGSFDGKKVAVKRQLLDFYDIAEHEVTVLQDSDDHPNVIRYYCRERCDRFLYIALELCQTTLHEAVERANVGQQNLLASLTQAQLLYQIASGLQHLHALQLVHRDLKPQNILIMAKGSGKSSGGNSVRVLISDFGLCKRLDADQSSFGDTAVRQGSGSVGWRAPELLLAIETGQMADLTQAGTGIARITKSIDVFAAGCLFYYALSGGKHPFGDRYEREARILTGRYDLSALDTSQAAETEARDLIASMIQLNPRERPTMAQVLSHPFFWSADKRIAFLQDASDRLEAEPRETSASPLLTRLEANSISVVGLDWSKRLDRSMLGQLNRFRRYDTANVRDLLRAIRNKKHHYQDLPEAERRILGTIPDGFLSYFSARFPLLLQHVYYVLASDNVTRADPVFQTYYNTVSDAHRMPSFVH